MTIQYSIVLWHNVHNSTSKRIYSSGVCVCNY